jgi:hypothetical protein
MRLFVLALLLASIAIGLRLRTGPHDAYSSSVVPHATQVFSAVQLTPGWRLAPPQASRVQTLEVRLPAAAVQSAATCQVAVLTDHRGSFVWECRLGSGQTRLVVPLRQAAGWRAIDHDGAWSAWELACMREVEIKLFDQAGRSLPLAGRPDAVWLTSDPPPASLLWLQPGPGTMALGTRWECRFDTADGGINPWDPTTSGLRLAWTDPSGRSTDLPPFLHQEFRAVERHTGEVLIAQGPKHLRVRARPTISGIHTWRLLLGDQTLATGSVTVGDGTPPRFLRIDPARPRWFLDPAGRTFQPIGWNIAYPADRPYGVDLRPYLPRVQRLSLMLHEIDAVADAGGNCIRFWLSDWWGGLEWNDQVDAYQGIGRWNLRHAWLVDQVLKHCEQRGIAVLLTHLNHVRLSSEYGWRQHPYATHNGGFLDGPQDYWRDPRAADAADAAVAAALARWADSPTVLAWDYMSESDLMSFGNWATAKRHILGRLEALRRRDPWHHPTSNHLCVQDTDPSLAAEPGWDFFSSNAYPDTASLPPFQAEAVRRFAQIWAGASKPVLIAEYGGHWAGAPPAQMARDLEAGLWAGVGSPLAGAPLAWWWNVISADDMGSIWRAASAYLAADDPAAEDLRAPGSWRERPVQVICDQPVATFSVGSDRVRRIILLAQRALYRCEAEPPPCGPATVSIDGLQPGPCDLEHWDGRGTAPVRVEQLVIPPDGRVTLHSDPFARVIALRLRPAGTAVAAAAPPEPISAPVPSSIAGDVAWKLIPLVPAAPAALADRLVAEATIALPVPLGSRHPRVHLDGGAELPCAWEALDGGRGLHLRLPGTLSAPCTVTLAETPGPSWSCDPTRIGLLAEAVPTAPGARQHQALAALVATAPGRTGPVRVDGIDQTDNPCGLGPVNVTTRYLGPLLLPAGAQTLAINADDVMSVQLDGRPVVARLDPGGMDVENRPAQNRWRHHGQATTTQGFHLLEACHVQYGGAQLARLGWQWTAPDAADPVLPGGPTTPPGTLATLPPWRCDGRIPLAIEIIKDGRRLARILPSAALELRSPRRRLPTIALAGADGVNDLRILPSTGWQQLSIAGTTVPVWVGNRHARAVSLTWRAITDDRESPALDTMAIDAELDLALEVGGRKLPVKRHAMRTWVRWDLLPADLGQGFRVMAGGVPLYEGRLPPAPGRIDGLGLRIDPAWFVCGLSNRQILAHVEASLEPGGTVTLARELDRGQRQVRDLLQRLHLIVRERRVRLLDEERP